MPEGVFPHFLLQNRPEVQAAPLRSPGSPACFVIASAQALVAGEGALASFRPVGARAAFPPEPLALASFARPRHSSHGCIRSNPQFIVLSSSSGFVARCHGWSI